MAAIKPHLALDDENSEQQNAYWRCASDSGLGAAEGEICPNPNEIANEAHAELLNTAWIRSALIERMQDARIWIEYEKGEPVIAISSPAPGPAWNPSGGAKRTTILGWTTKMGAPSFSLPAGARAMGGACPGATAGQTIADPKERRDQAAKLLPVLNGSRRANGPRIERVDVTQAICEFCLSGSSRVLVLGRGLVRLDELNSDEEILVWSGQAWRQTRVVYRGIQPVVRLRSSWGHELIATADHEVLSNGVKVAISNLSVEDVLDTADPTESPFSSEVPLSLKFETRHHNDKNPSYPKAWSYEVGAALGWLAGDGTLYVSKYPCLSLAKGGESLDDMRRVADWINEWTGSKAELRTIPTNVHTISWHTRSAVELVQQLGLDKTENASVRRVPASIWTASRDGVRGFLAGIFATDGCVQRHTDRVTVSLAQVSYDFLRECQLLLAAFGVRSNICEYSSNRKRGYLPLYKLEISADSHVRRFSERISIDHRKKNEKLIQHLKEVKPKTPRASHTVVEIVTEPISEEPVFDLVNVGDEHTFWANGLIVSNCYAEGGQYSTSGVQSAQLLRYAWAQRAIERPGREPGVSEFYSVMLDAIDNVDFKHGQEPKQYSDKRFFRLHDSGDFFSMRYLREWKKITLYYHPRVGGPGLRFRDTSATSFVIEETGKGHPNPIYFWAPTRVWATGQSAVELISEINKEHSDNFAIRPSAYHINQRGPFIKLPGWAAPTTVYDHDEKMSAEGVAYDWDCRAYAVEKGPSCRGAESDPEGPGEGREGCRECWLQKHKAVNYTLHL